MISIKKQETGTEFATKKSIFYKVVIQITICQRLVILKKIYTFLENSKIFSYLIIPFYIQFTRRINIIFLYLISKKIKKTRVKRTRGKEQGT